VSVQVRPAAPEKKERGLAKFSVSRKTETCTKTNRFYNVANMSSRKRYRLGRNTPESVAELIAPQPGLQDKELIAGIGSKAWEKAARVDERAAGIVMFEVEELAGIINGAAEQFHPDAMEYRSALLNGCRLTGEEYSD
jgi:hypothetical protein